MRTKDDTILHFKYKAPNPETLPKYEKVTQSFIRIVADLYDDVPDGPGKTLALRKLSEARMAFNSAIANGGQ